MKVHTIGDSHSSFGWPADMIISHGLGPCLCYSFGKDPFARCKFTEYGIRDGDVVIFCLGEIDCRCHIYKHVSGTLSYQSIINEIAVAYLSAIKALVSASGLKDLRIYVYNIVPPVHKALVPNNPEFPFLGTDQDRLQYALYFNAVLRRLCTDDIGFFDIYSKYSDSTGFIRYELSDYMVHIKDGTYIREHLNNILISIPRVGNQIDNP